MGRLSGMVRLRGLRYVEHPAWPVSSPDAVWNAAHDYWRRIPSSLVGPSDAAVASAEDYEFRYQRVLELL